MLQKTICIDNIIEKIWVAGWVVAIKADMALQGPLANLHFLLKPLSKLLLRSVLTKVCANNSHLEPSLVCHLFLPRVILLSRIWPLIKDAESGESQDVAQTLYESPLCHLAAGSIQTRLLDNLTFLSGASLQR